MVKRVKTDDLIEMLLDFYPFLTRELIIPSATSYILPTLQEVTEAVKRNSVAHFQARKNVMECEKFSLFLRAAILRERDTNWKSLPEDERHSWFLGEAYGFKRDKFSKGTSHKKDLVITSDAGIIEIEPQTDVIRPADEKKFSVFIFIV